MEKDKLPFPSTLSKSSLKLPKSTASATGNPRNKHVLKPGCSLMDWIRLGNSGADLSGTGGRLRSVSKEELAKHDQINDAWIAIGGVVYNVTQYMGFHPGGTAELMRGVGTDATNLFREAHAWVNYSQLLNKCLIGPLMNEVKIDTEIKELFSVPDNNRFPKPQISAQQKDVMPRLDWVQKLGDLTLYFYTKQYCNPGILIRKLIHDYLHLEVWISIGPYAHKFAFELKDRFNWPPEKVHISTESGRIEVKLRKHDEHLWNDLGTYKISKMLASQLELDIPLEFATSFKYKFNNDSFVMSLKNESILYFLPVGYHLTIEDFVNGQKLIKCYTPVPKNYIKSYVNTEIDMEHIHFLIKHYPNPNCFSQYLCNLKKNSKLKVSLPKGCLNLSTLALHKNFCLLAAGSGLTPFLSVIDHLLSRNSNRIEVIKLMYFNKTIEDIWCRDFLQTVSKQDDRFEFVNILSRADELWSGLRGKVNSELLFPIVNISKENLPYIAACGPNDFVESIKQILSEVNFPTRNLFIF